MVRKFLSLGVLAAAGLVLTACDNPASGLLATAKTGDCFSVTGKDAYGQPKLIKTDCPAGQASGSTIPAAASTETASTDAKPATDDGKTDDTTAASADTASTAAVCQPAAAVCAAPAAHHAVRSARYGHAPRYGHGRGVKRVHRVTHRRHGKVVTEVVTEYVDANGNEFTTAGPAGSAPPTTDTYVLGDHRLPPPVRDRREYERHEYEGHGYEGQGYYGHDYENRSNQSYGSSSHSYESHSYSSNRHWSPPPRPPCNCARDHEPQYAPDGYLTWPNKAPY